jgi:uncharacterized protein YbaP (TraB family)
MQARTLRTRPAGLGRLIAVAASVALTLFASPVHAEPSMWVVKDADSTLYLLGTFHLTKPGMDWWSDKIDTAFESSGELWLEASENGDDAIVQNLVLKYGFDHERPLSSKLSEDDWNKVLSATKLAGVPVSAIEEMQPWLAALALVVAPMVKAGYDPQLGADKQLEARAMSANKVVRTFETPEQQIQFFASLPEQSQVSFLVQSLDDVAVGPELMDRMAAAWVAGDAATLEVMTLQRVRDEAPDLYDALIVRRNRDWSEQIVTVMKGAGTSFVAVGAGHLIGEHSLPAILAERGFTVTPY